MTQSFGKYTLEKKLATGGMAEVWLARQTGIEGFNRHVVIKRILPHLAEDPEFVQMFLNEARVAARFNHPNIAQIYDLGENDGTYFIAMEFVHGEDLARIMRRATTTGQWVARPLALRIIADACAALHYAHTRTDDQGRPLKVVHRDISPQNILVSFDGSVKLVDFGIAKAADQVSSTKSGALKGKFAYMAPEQAQGRALDNRSDIFALGLVLYELITNSKPLKRESELATLQAALECVIDAPSVEFDVPPEIDEVVMKALSKQQEGRYANARQFQMALEQVLVAEGTVATSVQVSELMEHLFADRLEEEARIGAPAPASASSTSNVVAPAIADTHTQGEDPTRTLDEEPEAPEEDPDASPPRPVPDIKPVGPQAAPRPAGTQAAPRPEKTPARPATVEYDFKQSLTPNVVVGNTSDDLPPVVEPRQEPEPEEPEPEPAPEPSRGGDEVIPRRRTTGSIRKRPAGSMPEAPPRQSRSSLPSRPAVKRRRDSLADLNQALDVDSMRRRAAFRSVVLTLVLLMVSAGVLGFIFRDRLAPLLHIHTNGMISDGVPVLLTVTSNPPTIVTVVPSSGDQENRDLGATPLEKAQGAYVGDTVVLTNTNLGIHYEQLVDTGNPNELKIIDKTFKQVSLKVKTKPALRNATVFLDSLQIGKVGMSMKVYEGTQTFEIHSDALLRNVPFTMRLDPSKANAEIEVDVSGSVTGSRLP